MDKFDSDQERDTARRRADDLAVAMESRCYTGVGRTRLHEPRLRPVDWAALVVGVLVTVATAILFR